MIDNIEPAEVIDDAQEHQQTDVVENTFDIIRSITDFTSYNVGFAVSVLIGMDNMGVDEKLSSLKSARYFISRENSNKVTRELPADIMLKVYQHASNLDAIRARALVSTTSNQFDVAFACLDNMIKKTEHEIDSANSDNEQEA